MKERIPKYQLTLAVLSNSLSILANLSPTKFVTVEIAVHRPPSVNPTNIEAGKKVKYPENRGMLLILTSEHKIHLNFESQDYVSYTE